MQRLFTSGSRQAPDPYDQFLEQHNFYRKHTARDSSCLFRVISEQMYDTQIHHLEIRLQCVQYMRKHRNFFQNLVVRDIDEYLDDLAKPKTFGSLVELQALGFMFQRNVLLYEPYNLGNYFCNRAYFYKVFRVFYSPERHFDSVFPCDYIKDIAICQAICYEILYKDLFELPDVNYAVEKMLHVHGGAYESSESRFDYTDDGYASRVYLTNGRYFDLDTPKTTNCILENDKLCHFHYPNFPRFTEELQKELRNHANHNDSTDNTMINRTFESLLPDKYVSCVRQLLREGITPFPYKVAKALDPSMYRNIEFDAWNEARKEQRLANWYSGDSNFKVGAKCNVRLKKSENDLYTCHIQEISMDKGYCVVFIEQLGEKRMVPYESLSPLPPEQFKPWSLPYRLQRHVRYPRHYNYQFKFNGSFGNGSHMDLCTPISSIKSENWDDFNEKGGGGVGNNGRHIIHPWYNKDGYVYRLRQYTNLDNFQPPAMEYCTMPFSLEFNSVKQTTNDNQAKTNDTNSNETITATIQNSNPTSTDLVLKTENTDEQITNAHLPPANEGPGNALIPVNNEEHLVNNFDNLSLEPAITTVNMTSAYMSDGCCYYGTYSSVPYFGPVDDFYSASFGYDYQMNCPTGPVYYMYTPQPANFSYATPNMYISAPAPAPATHPLATLPAHNPPISYQAIPPPPPPQAQPQPQSANPNNLLTNPAPAIQSPYMHSTQSTQTHYSSINMQYNNQMVSTAGATAVPQTAYSTPNLQNMHTNSSSSNSYHSPLNRNRYSQHNINTNETPTNGRINMDARKSVKANGIDLPQDINTLRFFYNLGIDYHKSTSQKPKLENDKSQNDQQQQQQQQQQHQQQQQSKEKEKLDENANSHDTIKSDANNNPTNYNSNKNSYHPRRFNNHRFFGSARERTNSQRPSNVGSNANQGFNHNNNNNNNNNRNQNLQNDYNHNVINKASSYHSKPSSGGGGNGNGNSASTPNSSRTHLMSSGSGPNTGSNSHSGSSVSSGRGGGGSSQHNNGNDHLTRSSPLLNETPSGNNGGGSASGSGQTPNSYSNHQNGPGGGSGNGSGNSSNGPYEQIGDGLHTVQNIYNGPPPNTPSTTAVPPPPHFANGMFIPMGPPPPYGMYTPNGPPPPSQAAQTPGGVLNGPTNYLQPPPTPSGSQHFPGSVGAQYAQMPPPPPSAATLVTANGMSCPTPINNGVNNTLFVPTPVGSDISENTNGNGLINPDATTANAQPYYQPITYPPPGPPPQLAGGIPFFYPTMGGPNIHSNGMIMNNASQNPGQVYWSQPPAHPHAGPNHAPQQSHSSENFVVQKPSNDNIQSSNSNHSTGGSNKRSIYSKSNINANTGGK